MNHDIRASRYVTQIDASPSCCRRPAHPADSMLARVHQTQTSVHLSNIESLVNVEQRKAMQLTIMLVVMAHAAPMLGPQPEAWCRHACCRHLVQVAALTQTHCALEIQVSEAHVMHQLQVNLQPAILLAMWQPTFFLVAVLTNSTTPAVELQRTRRTPGIQTAWDTGAQADCCAGTISTRAIRAQHCSCSMPTLTSQRSTG